MPRTKAKPKTTNDLIPPSSSSSSSSKSLPITITTSRAPVEKNPSARKQSVLNGNTLASSSLSSSNRTRRQVNSSKNAVTESVIVLSTPTTAITATESSPIPSERYIAEVLHSVQSQNPNIDPVGCLESTVYEFHQRRRDLVDCLIYLLEACDASEHEGVYPIVQRIESFVREELIIPVPLPGGGEIPLAYRIFKQIEAMGGMIQRADNARKSARSNSIIPPVNQGPPSLGSDILTSRYESLKHEHRCLSRVLYLMARCGHLSPNEIKHFTEWLSLNPNHDLTYHMLTTLLSALDPVDPKCSRARFRRALTNDSTTISFMTKKLDPLTEWKEPGLKATVLLKWTLFLTEHRHRNPNVENRSGFRTEELEVQIWNAVQGDVFTYLSGAVLQLYRRQSTLTVPSLLSNLTLTSEQLEQREVPEEDFKPDVLTAFESLIRSLITHASSELRKIKQRQEDLVHANIRTDRSRGFSASRFGATNAPSQGSDKQPRNDIAMLYSFIGLLYSCLAPETALQFWGSGGQTDSRATYLEVLESTAGRLPTFLQWAVWSTQAHDATIMSMALYDMLAGLATGQQCSELAYNFMARGRGEVIPGTTLSSSSSGSSSVSWDVIFGTLDAWSTGTTARAQGQPQGLGNSGFGGQSFSSTPQQQNHINIGPNDVLRAQSYLRLLSTVVTHSIAVRLALSNHAHFRAIPTLVSLIPLSVPLELKGMIFETLASFCQPGAGIPGVEICRAVWTCMERMEVINVRASSNAGFGDSFRPVKGVEVEFEEIEALHGLYPATIPFLKLLSTLIHTPKRIPLKDRVTDASPINTTPETLGQPYRLPGIGPFVSFVIDNVFSKISSREYLRPSQRWEMNDLCLSFIERVLASYDLESLLTAAEGDLKAASIAPFLVHPGYDVMKRILTNTNLQAVLLSYVVEGLEGFEKGFAHNLESAQNHTPRTSIVHLSSVQSIRGLTSPNLTKLSCLVPAVAAYATFPAFHEVVFLSVKIITMLSSSSTFANLATLIERSDDSERILAGYLRIMSVESFDDVSLAEASAEQTTGAGAPDPNEGTPSPQATRLAVLDMLIQNTEANVPYPSIAHFLLFGSTNQEQGIQDPHALGAKRACIHIILDLINAGVPRLKNKGKERYHDIQNLPMFASLPELAERCYHVVYKLCVHPRSSTFTMRYLRTREDFFARHLAAVPSIAPGADMDAQDGESESLIQVLYGDGSRVPTTIPTLSSFLRLRSWIFDLVALDLHVLTRKGHHRAVSELLEILFNNESTLDESPWEDDISKPFREVGQSHLRVIEFVQSLTFEWEDSLVVEPMEIQLLSQLNLQSCVRKDSSGCEIVNPAPSTIPPVPDPFIPPTSTSPVFASASTSVSASVLSTGDSYNNPNPNSNTTTKAPKKAVRAKSTSKPKVSNSKSVSKSKAKPSSTATVPQASVSTRPKRNAASRAQGRLTQLIEDMGRTVKMEEFEEQRVNEENLVSGLMDVGMNVDGVGVRVGTEVGAGAGIGAGGLTLKDNTDDTDIDSNPDNTPLPAAEDGLLAQTGYRQNLGFTDPPGSSPFSIHPSRWVTLRDELEENGRAFSGMESCLVPTGRPAVPTWDPAVKREAENEVLKSDLDTPQASHAALL
ncbi:hypothetical protein K435DRAFT_873712 [Dendrothele bispora CBS 962.96]|uniref:Uncharacterized protein n=1 Tax=Dendrothele bispora (strain CBS 962.96) TaxID=1314807 RepID=A0A4S8KYU0_DENBC|nr:hypothetical protein K435DRAFT_873712 [Dendrothele bispora CBS 962.96]